MAQLCIENSTLIIGREFDDNAELLRLIADPGNYCSVLYPGAEARNIGLESREEIESGFPSGRTPVIIVIDGTWKIAKKMLRRSRGLSCLPRLCFTPESPSEYRIRQQPHVHCLSTIEAIHRVLRILDPDTDPSPLLDVFRGMVAEQVRHNAIQY